MTLIDRLDLSTGSEAPDNNRTGGLIK